VAQQPPEPRRPTGAAVVVRDDEDPVSNPRPRGRGAECLRARQRVTPLPLDREVRELVDPEEGRARDVPFEVALPTGLDAREVVAAVDEPVLDQ
jgi:hypothetical protein